MRQRDLFAVKMGKIFTIFHEILCVHNTYVTAVVFVGLAARNLFNFAVAAKSVSERAHQFCRQFLIDITQNAVEGNAVGAGVERTLVGWNVDNLQMVAHSALSNRALMVGGFDAVQFAKDGET